MDISKEEALAILKGIVATNAKYQEFSAGIGSIDPLQLGKSLNAILYHACENGDVDVLRLAFFAGGNLNERFKGGITLVHIAVSRNRLECLKFLADQKLNLESRERCGDTPAHYAARFNRLDCLRLLAERGVDLEDRYLVGPTPSEIAREFNYHRIWHFIDEFLSKKESH